MNRNQRSQRVYNGERFLRILYVIDSLSGGGAEKLIADIIPFIAKDFYCEVLLLTTEGDKYSESIKSFGVKISIVPYRGHFRRIKYIKSYISEGGFDIIHANLFPVIYYCSVCRRMLKNKSIQFVMTEHNTDNRRRHIKWMRIIEKYIYASYDYIISISEGVQNSLTKWLRPKQMSKYIVVENGVPLNNFYYAQAHNRNELVANIFPSSILLCMIGSFTEQKNHRMMIGVMKKLPPQYHLICLGEGPLFDEIRAEVKNNQLDDRVHFLGFRKDVASIIKACDIGVIPSRWEGFGLAAVEELACGLPIVCSDVPGLADVVGKAGIKCKVDNADCFAKGILEAMGIIQPEEARQQASKYDIKNMANGYLEIYKRSQGVD